MTASTLASAPPLLPPGAALFLDFDGTLVPLAQRPQDVRVPDWVVPALSRLRQTLGGALAIVSGRPLVSIDAFLSPLVLTAAGAHGVQHRHASGAVDELRADPPGELVRAAQALAAAHTGLIFEPKPAGFALHFRLNLGMGETCRSTLESGLARVPGGAAQWELLTGHFVYELKQRAISKGRAVQAYLAEPPFAGRVPVFIGDDVTDEDGIAAVQAAGGFGIRVGSGSSQARYRMADTDAVAAWLIAAAAAAHTPDDEESHSA